MLEKIKKMIAEQLELDISEITEASSFMEDLGADSIDMFDFAMDLEDEFDIVLTDDDLGHIRTVGDVIEHLKKNGIDK